MSEATIGRWGKNLAVRFPADLARASGFSDGERVEVVLRESEVVIRRAPPEPTAADLFRGRTAEEWRRFYDDADDWGPDRGREIIEE